MGCYISPENMQKEEFLLTKGKMIVPASQTALLTR